MTDIKVEFGSGLLCIRYTFWFDGKDLYLDSLSHLTRETKRHGWKEDKTQSYVRVHGRGYGITEEPDIPIEIQVDALDALRKKIKFKRWENR